MPRRVEDIRLDDRPDLDTFVRRLGAAGGFSAQGVARGVDLLVRIMGDEEMTTCTARVAVPVDEDDNPWRRRGDQWNP